jgi:hypothetical protein
MQAVLVEQQIMVEQILLEELVEAEQAPKMVQLEHLELLIPVGAEAEELPLGMARMVAQVLLF